MKLRDLWTLEGPLSRHDYAQWGGVLFALKYNLDRLIVGASGNGPGYPCSDVSGWNLEPAQAEKLLPSEAETERAGHRGERTVAVKTPRVVRFGDGCLLS